MIFLHTLAITIIYLAMSVSPGHAPERGLRRAAAAGIGKAVDNYAIMATWEAAIKGTGMLGKITF
jgi:hypothetical protein